MISETDKMLIDGAMARVQKDTKIITDIMSKYAIGNAGLMSTMMDQMQKNTQIPPDKLQQMLEEGAEGLPPEMANLIRGLGK